MIQEIHEHTVDLSLLPEKSNILDLGCRGFLFTNYFRDLGHNVVAVDIDDFPNQDYHKLAISDSDGFCDVVHTSDPQAKHITDGGSLKKMTIDSFSKMVGVEKWDLIKIDIEGSEIGILKNSTHPLAKQVSVEFHAHCVPSQTKEELDNLLNYLSRFYDIHNREWKPMHGVGCNYWSVLLISK